MPEQALVRLLILALVLGVIGYIVNVLTFFDATWKRIIHIVLAVIFIIALLRLLIGFL